MAGKNGAAKPRSDDQTLERALDLIAEGVKLRDVSAQLEISTTTLHRLLTREDAAEQYARARRVGAHSAFEKAMAELENCQLDNAAVSKHRAIIENYRWALGKIDRATFGEHQSLRVETVEDISDEDLDARIAAKLAKVTGDGVPR